MKKIAKIFATLISLQMLVTPVCAEDITISYNSTSDATPTQTSVCSVDVEKAEIYSVKLPKSVTLDGSKESPTYEYTVEVHGEISDDKYVRCIPLDTAYIENNRGTRYPVTVEQEVRKWTCAEALAGATTTGTMTAADLNPGKYTGQVEFFVSLDDGYFYTPATCTTASLRSAFDANDNGVQDAGEELNPPEPVGQPLGHAYEGEHQFQFNCTRCRQTVYEVSTPQELVAFSSAVASGNTFSGATINLINDIDMYELTSVTPFTPIGTNSCVFSGTFDGNSHKISGIAQLNSFVTGLYPDSVDSSVSGLFGRTSDACIKNLVFTDSNITISMVGRYGVTYGCILGYATGSTTLENVRVTDVTTTIVVPGDANNVRTGPFICRMHSGPTTITNCAATGVFTTVDARANTLNRGTFTHNAFKFGYTGGGALTVSNSYAEVTASHMSTSASTESVINLYDSYYSCATTFSNLPYQTDGTNCVALTDEELKSQTGVDLLNTGHDTPVWKLDLLNENNGYPIQIIN